MHAYGKQKEKGKGLEIMHVSPRKIYIIVHVYSHILLLNCTNFKSTYGEIVGILRTKWCNERI